MLEIPEADIRHQVFDTREELDSEVADLRQDIADTEQRQPRTTLRGQPLFLRCLPTATGRGVARPTLQLPIGSAERVTVTGGGVVSESPQGPQWDGTRWVWWDGTQWTTWDGSRWVPLPRAAPAAVFPESVATPPAIQPTRQTTTASSKTVWIVMGLVVLLGLAWAGVGVVSRMMSSATDVTSAVQVTYLVAGTSSAGMVTYSTASGMEQVDAGPAWSRSIMVKSGTPVSLSAQNGGEFGSVTCRISVNGAVVSTNTSSAAFGIASCSGLAR